MYAKHKIILLLTLISLVISDETVVSVNTHNGRVIGRQQVLFDNCAVNSFLGIPYAKPPIGNLRFKKPQPVSSWSQPRDANEWPNPCYQIPITNTFQNTNFSEDCLYLNIWSPVCDNNCLNNSGLKAVMFFIHGGGLFAGSSSEYEFAGEMLSTKGCVVVVTINYRLGFFGFLYSGTHSAPGNMGLWDMVLALEWVRDNIAYFGGDKNRITIFGQSGGSWAVSILILSPISRDLYSQAALMSGALISSEIANQTLAKNNWLKASTLIGCANSTNHAFNSVIMDCLRRKNASDLAGILISPDLVGDLFGELPLVIIDGIFLPESPVEMFECGNCKQNFNILIESVEDEGQATVSLFDTDYSPTSPSNLNYSEVRYDLKDFVQRTPLYVRVNGEQAVRLYFSMISPNSTDYDLLRRTVTIGYGDLGLGCPTLLFGRSLFSKCNANVYQYFYNSHFGANQSVYFCGDWMGACHGSDLTPVFGLPFIRSDVSSDAQKTESERVIGFYSHFSTNGYPSQQNGIEWQKYYELHGNIVSPYYTLNNTFGSFDLSDNYFSYGLKITECLYLWKKYVYVSVPN